MSITVTLLQGGGAGALLLGAAAIGRRWPRGRVHVTADLGSEQVDAIARQTEATERQIKASNRVVERMTKLDVRLDETSRSQQNLATEVRELVTEVRGLRDELHGVDRRVIRLEAQQPNGHRNESLS